MPQKIELSVEEEQVLRPILMAMSNAARHDLTLMGLLEKWSEFVLTVERGYDYSIYEYTNDLSVRDLLETVTTESPQGLRNKLVKEIGGWDERFMTVTRKASRPLVVPIGKKPAWWWFRVPIHPGDELRTDLRAEGLAE